VSKEERLLVPKQLSVTARQRGNGEG